MRGLPPLPIDLCVGSLRDALAGSNAAVLIAPPGAGKTTRVPLALLDEPWLEGRRIIMLEPRRLAARTAARRMATSIGESVGARVGFRVRGESRVGRDTRIEVVTEGVLTRMLQADPTLNEIGLVIFDEFHERNLHSDIGLAFALQIREVLRPELRLLVMSATMDGDAVAALLDGAPIVMSEGRAFPVEIRYIGRAAGQRVEGAVAAAIRAALSKEEGGILAFLPGAGEIRRCAELLDAGSLPREVRVLPLYGDLPIEAQDAAIAPPARGERKVVLATSIAETSLTIEHVRIVIDGGLARIPRFSPRSGMSSLSTVRVSRAAADQRAGRAGRVAPGICFRLWSEGDQAGLLERTSAEIKEADLAGLALELAVAGIHDPASLRWLDPPPNPALAQGRELLRQLGALDGEHLATSHGRAMAALGTHPRLAHMLLRGRALGHGAAACVVAALLDDRDVMRRAGFEHEPDLRARFHAVVEERRIDDSVFDPGALARARERSRRWRSQLGIETQKRVDDSAVGWLVALAYPDRVARRRGADGRYLMRGGGGAALAIGSALTRSEFLAIATVDDLRPHARILLAAPLEQEDIELLYANQVESSDVVEWDAGAEAVVARRREYLGAIVLRERPVSHPDEVAIARVLLRNVAGSDLASLPWSDAARAVRERLAFLHELDGDRWPAMDDASLRDTSHEWLMPRLVGLRRAADLRQLDLCDALLSKLAWQERRALDELAPTHVRVPSGSNIRVDYSKADTPVLAVRLQEMFGLHETPTIAGGRVTLTLHLLSPANRPVQVTRDLAGFWRTAYHEIRRELRARYPKHAWPEHPSTATPTRRRDRSS